MRLRYHLLATTAAFMTGAWWGYSHGGTINAMSQAWHRPDREVYLRREPTETTYTRPEQSIDELFDEALEN